METKSDALGRVVLPAPIRHQLGIEAGDPLDLQFDGAAITIKPLNKVCTFCGNPADDTVMDKGICDRCAKLVRNL